MTRLHRCSWHLPPLEQRHKPQPQAAMNAGCAMPVRSPVPSCTHAQLLTCALPAASVGGRGWRCCPPAQHAVLSQGHLLGACVLSGPAPCSQAWSAPAGVRACAPSGLPPPGPAAPRAGRLLRPRCPGSAGGFRLTALHAGAAGPGLSRPYCRLCCPGCRQRLCRPEPVPPRQASLLPHLRSPGGLASWAAQAGEAADAWPAGPPHRRLRHRRHHAQRDPHRTHPQRAAGARHRAGRDLRAHASQLPGQPAGEARPASRLACSLLHSKGEGADAVGAARGTSRWAAQVCLRQLPTWPACRHASAVKRHARPLLRSMVYGSKPPSPLCMSC